MEIIQFSTHAQSKPTSALKLLQRLIGKNLFDGLLAYIPTFDLLGNRVAKFNESEKKIGMVGRRCKSCLRGVNSSTWG